MTYFIRISHARCGLKIEKNKVTRKQISYITIVDRPHINFHKNFKKRNLICKLLKKPIWQGIQKEHIMCSGEMGESPVLDHTQRPADQLYLWSGTWCTGGWAPGWGPVCLLYWSQPYTQYMYLTLHPAVLTLHRITVNLYNVTHDN